MIFQSSSKFNDITSKTDSEASRLSCSLKDCALKSNTGVDENIDKKHATPHYEIDDNAIQRQQFDELPSKTKGSTIAFSEEVQIFEFDKHEVSALSVLQYFKKESSYKIESFERNIKREELRKIKKQKKKLKRIAMESNFSKIF